MTTSRENRKSIQSRLAAREKRVRSTAEGIAALFERLGGSERARLNALWRQWAEVMGEALAALGSPLGCKNGVLDLGAEDAMALQELSLLSGEILDKANAFMGSAFFTKLTVHLQQGRPDLARPRPARPAQEPVPVCFRRQPALGSLLGRLDPDSPVTRCYEAHVAASARKGSPGS